MKNLYDFLVPYIQLDDSSTFSFEVLKSFNLTQTVLLVDKFLDKNILKKRLSLLGNNIEEKHLSINRNKEELEEILKVLKEDNFKSFTCFNNGLAIPKNLNLKYFIFLFSVFPLYEEGIENLKYKDRFLRVVPHRINNSLKTFVFSNVHLNLALSFGIEREKLCLVYPFVKPIYKPLDRLLALSYIKAKFNINTSYIYASGAINEGYNLKRLLNYFDSFQMKNKDTILVVYGISIKNDYRKLLNKENIILLEEVNEQDEVNFLNAAIAFVDFSSQYLFNLSKVKALFTNTVLITDLTPLNLEYFEDYPVYEVEDSLNRSILNHMKESMDQDSLSDIKSKFSGNRNKEIIIDIYQGGNEYE